MPSVWIGLAGPTAAGKTDAALAVARALADEGRRVEVVSVDSALVYRGMDIGTAKPTAAEREEVPHHLLDLLDPSEAYSAARFVADAQAAIADITARGALPLLVGGTMLYFKALVDGLDAMPEADPEVREALDVEAAERGWPALHADLREVDPATAERLKPHDAQRIQRALEVYRSSGRPLSSFHRRETLPTGARPPLIALEPADRAWLHDRIARRFAAMLQAGFLDEVRRLRARGDLHPGLPSMRAVGYRQAWEALDQDPDTPNFDALAERGIAATRQLAKRQLTWLRSWADRRSVAADAPDAADRVIQAVRQSL